MRGRSPCPHPWGGTTPLNPAPLISTLTEMSRCSITPLLPARSWRKRPSGPFLLGSFREWSFNLGDSVKDPRGGGQPGDRRALRPSRTTGGRSCYWCHVRLRGPLVRSLRHGYSGRGRPSWSLSQPPGLTASLGHHPLSVRWTSEHSPTCVRTGKKARRNIRVPLLQVEWESIIKALSRIPSPPLPQTQYFPPTQC